MFKKHKVVMLPNTGDVIKERHVLKCIKSFDLGMIDDFHNAEKEGTLFYGYNIISKEFYSWNNEHWQSQHLYLLLDEEISYNPNGGTDGLFLCLHELDHPKDALVTNVGNCKGCRKIIASTDESLGLPKLPEDFIKHYCKSKGIDEVEIEYENKYIEPEGIHCNRGYDVEVIKLTPDNTIIVNNTKKTLTLAEVEKLCRAAFNAGVEKQKAFKLWEDSDYKDDESFDKIPSENRWIEENL